MFVDVLAMLPRFHQSVSATPYGSSSIYLDYVGICTPKLTYVAHLVHAQASNTTEAERGQYMQLFPLREISIANVFFGILFRHRTSKWRRWVASQIFNQACDFRCYHLRPVLKDLVSRAACNHTPTRGGERLQSLLLPVPDR